MARSITISTLTAVVALGTMTGAQAEEARLFRGDGAEAQLFSAGNSSSNSSSNSSGGFNRSAGPRFDDGRGRRVYERRVYRERSYEEPRRYRRSRAYDFYD